MNPVDGSNSFNYIVNLKLNDLFITENDVKMSTLMVVMERKQNWN